MARTLLLCLALFGIALLVPAKASEGPGHGTEEAVASLLEEAALRRAEAEYEGARALLMEAESRLGPETSVELRAEVLVARGALENEAGNFERARDSLGSALELLQTGAEPDPTLMAVALNGVGFSYQKQGRPEEAEPFFLDSLPYYEQAEGPKGARLAVVNSNLGELYRTLGDLERARHHAERAVAIVEQNPDIAISTRIQTINNLGTLSFSEGDRAGALTHFTKALDLARAELPNPHPTTASLGGNVGVLHYFLGEYDEAARLMREALAMEEALYGADSPHLVTTLQGLLDTEAARGNVEAETALRERINRLSSP